MAILRKSCRNCTVSKRKCTVELPRCTRCAQRGLDCTYDLEPLSAPTTTMTTQPSSLPNMTFNPSSCDTPGYCIMKTCESRASTGLDPEFCLPGHMDAGEVVRTAYHRVPDLVRAGKPASFIHPKLLLRQSSKCSSSNHVAIFEKIGTSGVTKGHFQRLVQLDIKTVPAEEALSALQALLIHLAIYVFPPAGEKATEERYLTLLQEWAQTLWRAGIPARRGASSAWQNWLFGESVRRTIFMSYVLLMCVSSHRNGYCAYWLFLESLPFDRRAGLWMAESPQAWIAAAGARTGDEVGEQLSSFHEFAVACCDGPDRTFCGDQFLALLTVAHNGH